MIYDENEVLAEGYKAISGKAYHASDCATSCAPACRPNPCDCDGPPLWRPYENRPHDATVLVTVVPGPEHSHPESYVPQTLPAYIDEEGQICDPSTWAPDKGLHGAHWRTIAWMPLPAPAIADTHPKDGDVEQAPLVSGGGSGTEIAQQPPSSPLNTNEGE